MKWSRESENSQCHFFLLSTCLQHSPCSLLLKYTKDQTPRHIYCLNIYLRVSVGLKLTCGKAKPLRLKEKAAASGNWQPSNGAVGRSTLKPNHCFIKCKCQLRALSYGCHNKVEIFAVSRIPLKPPTGWQGSMNCSQVSLKKWIRRWTDHINCKMPQYIGLRAWKVTGKCYFTLVFVLDCIVWHCSK